MLLSEELVEAYDLRFDRLFELLEVRDEGVENDA
jgi:hypothetical protein